MIILAELTIFTISLFFVREAIKQSKRLSRNAHYHLRSSLWELRLKLLANFVDLS